jgi:hypothetical protein
MSNWFYNEVEMMNKHKMLGDAGRQPRLDKQAARWQAQGLMRSLLVAFGRSLVSAGGSLLRRYESAPGGQVLAETEH